MHGYHTPEGTLSDGSLFSGGALYGLARSLV